MLKSLSYIISFIGTFFISYFLLYANHVQTHYTFIESFYTFKEYLSLVIAIFGCILFGPLMFKYYTWEGKAYNKAIGKNLNIPLWLVASISISFIALLGALIYFASTGQLR